MFPHWSYLSIVVGSCSTNNFKTSVNPVGALIKKGDVFGSFENDRHGTPRFTDKQDEGVKPSNKSRRRMPNNPIVLTISFWIIYQNDYFGLKAKLNRAFAWFMSNFSGSLMFCWMPAWVILDLLNKDEPDGMDYVIAIFLCHAFILFFVADIVGYCKKN